VKSRSLERRESTQGYVPRPAVTAGVVDGVNTVNSVPARYGKNTRTFATYRGPGEEVEWRAHADIGSKTTPTMAAGVENRVWAHRDIAPLLD
jgi:hypothetical protein